MIENSSIEIGCIYFFQITINVFSSSSLQLVYWEGLNKSTPTVILVIYRSISHLFADSYNQFTPSKTRSTRYQGGVSVSCLDSN